MKLATIAAILFTALPAQSQPGRNCAHRDTVVGNLASKYGETRQSVGLTDAGMVETFASASGSWSITVTTPNMMTCMVASGQAWEQLAEALPPMGKDGHRRR